MEKTLSLKLLGEFSAEIEAVPPLSFAARRAEVMLAYLAITGRPHAREKLATLLWDDRTQKQALANLRSLLAQLPKPLKPYLDVNRQTVSINEDAPIWLDTTAFITEIENADAQWPNEAAVEQIEAALTLYRGDFLEGVLVRESRGLEEWIAITAERFQRVSAVARRKLATHYLHHRRYDKGIYHAAILLRLDPLHEKYHRLLMLLMARNGERNAALRQYQNCAALLMEELSVEPAAETTALYDRIRQARTPPPFAVPTQFTPFIGRQKALAEINRRLDNPDCRLLTLTGPGGVGKTRLAIQAAEIHKGDYLHGIYFVPLAGTETAEQLPLSIARTLSFTFQDKTNPQNQLLNYLRQRELLLILDNFEHLVEEGAGLVQAIVREAPLVKVLISSRERLNLQAEWLQTVSGLSHPDENDESESLDAYEALSLFQQCAARHQPALALNGEHAAAAVRICRMLEGLPLGIELAAASLAIHPIKQVEAELAGNLDFIASHKRDLPQRHRSLRAVFRHSWDALNEREQAIYRRLSLFRGGFTSTAANEVAGAGAADLATFSHKSLLRLTDMDQYELHQVLRQYAAEQLAAHPIEAEDGRTHHSRFYMTLLADLTTELTSPEATNALSQINKNIENIRFAWQWAAEKRLIELIERGMKGLYQFYVLRGPFQEGYTLFQSAIHHLTTNQEQKAHWSPTILACLYTFLARFSYELAHYPDSAVTAQQAVTLSQQTGQTTVEAEAQLLWGRALWRMGDHETTKRHFQESLRLAQQAQAPQFEADALRGLGVLLADQGNTQNAVQQYEAALAIYHDIGDRGGEATTLNNLGNLYGDIGNYTEAQRHLKQALALYRRLGDRKGTGNALNNLGVAFRHQANHTRAADCYAQGLEIFRELGDRWREGLALINLSNIAIDQGNFTRAGNLLPQALTLFQAINDPSGQGNSLALTGKLYLQLGRFIPAQHNFEQALAKFEEAGHAYSQGLCLAYLCLTASYQGDYERALANGRSAIKIAQSIQNHPILATAQANLGLTQLLCEDYKKSQSAYRLAISFRQEIGEPLPIIEAQAGLALTLLAANQTAEALPLANQILTFIQQDRQPDRESPTNDGHPLDGAENPFFIYLACYKVLAANNDERAPAILEGAHTLLQKRAAKILDETLRRPFLQNVPFNRKILSLYNDWGKK